MACVCARGHGLSIAKKQRLDAPHKRQDAIPYSNQKRVANEGVSVWFDLDGEERVLAGDRWDRIEHNMRAIHKHIDAIRAQARWGVGSLAQAFAGFAALPEQASGRSYRDILGISPDELLTVELIDGFE